MHAFARYIAELETRLGAHISKLGGGPVTTIVGTPRHRYKARLAVYKNVARD